MLKKDVIREVLYEPHRIPVAKILLHLASILSAVLPSDISRLTSKQAAKLYKENQDKLLSARIIGDLLFQQMCIKSDKWSHEKEFRAIYPLEEKGEKGKCVSISELGLKPNRVICGFNCPDETKTKLNQISNEIGCGNAYQVKLSDNEFSTTEEIM